MGSLLGCMVGPSQVLGGWNHAEMNKALEFELVMEYYLVLENSCLKGSNQDRLSSCAQESESDGCLLKQDC